VFDIGEEEFKAVCKSDFGIDDWKPSDNEDDMYQTVYDLGWSDCEIIDAFLIRREGYYYVRYEDHDNTIDGYFIITKINFKNLPKHIEKMMLTYLKQRKVEDVI